MLDRTPFYAEGGGQLADQGAIRSRRAAPMVEVHDVQTPIPGLIVHRGQVASGEVTVGDAVVAEVDVEPAPRDQPGAHRHPPGAQGVPARRSARPRPRPARRTRRAGSASTSPRPRAVPAVGAARRRAGGQRGARRRPGRAGRGHDPGAGARRRGDGAVRREVRRRGAGRLGRRLGARALRRHPRAALRPARPGQDPRRVLDRRRACAGSRRWSASTPTSSWPASTRWSPS